MSNVLGIEIPVKNAKKAGGKVYLSFTGEDATLIRELRAKGVDVEAVSIAFYKKVVETLNNANPQVNQTNNNNQTNNKK